jgi:hypothetical protein
LQTFELDGLQGFSGQGFVFNIADHGVWRTSRISI